MTAQLLRLGVPVASWTLFFVFSLLVLTDQIEVNWFKGVLILLFLVIGVFSSAFVASQAKRESKS